MLWQHLVKSKNNSHCHKLSLSPTHTICGQGCSEDIAVICNSMLFSSLSISMKHESDEVALLQFCGPSQAGPLDRADLMHAGQGVNVLEWAHLSTHSCCVNICQMQPADGALWVFPAPLQGPHPSPRTGPLRSTHSGPEHSQGRVECSRITTKQILCVCEELRTDTRPTQQANFRTVEYCRCMRGTEHQKEYVGLPIAWSQICMDLNSSDGSRVNTISQWHNTTVIVFSIISLKVVLWTR